MAEKSEALSEIEWDNYPLECRTRFLGLCTRRQTASHGVIVHFIAPLIDECLDDYLTWLAIEGP